MDSEPRVLAVSQRVEEVRAYHEVRDCLDQEWTVMLEALDFLVVPVPNRVANVDSYLETIRPCGIVLTGGNDFSLDVYNAASPDLATTPSHARDVTEGRMLEWAIENRVPLLGCCRGMQAIVAHLGGRLTSLDHGKIGHVASPHDVVVAAEVFADWAASRRLTVNSFHHYGVLPDDLPEALVSFAAAEDGSVEGVIHRDLPIIGVMWHPERTNHAHAFDEHLIRELFGGGAE